jgi:hypothetical protein
MNKKFVIGFIIGIAALFGIIIVATREKPGPDLTAFAQCLTEKKAVFYGAWWCSHCQATKKLFGAAQKYLTYVECSTPDGQSQLPVCNEKKIEGYPTWIFADDSRLVGEVSLNDLAGKTGCELPPEDVNI